MTTYEDLCAATLPHGLMPLVVPELKTITLGGAVTGLGIEATSVWHGLPHESVTEMQLLTGDGRVVIATKDNEHSDLFYGFPNSYGTLGYTLALTIELMPVKPYVHVSTSPLTTRRAAWTRSPRSRATAATRGIRPTSSTGWRSATPSFTSRSARSATRPPG